MIAWLLTVKAGDSFKQKPWPRIVLILVVFGFVFIILTALQTVTEQAPQQQSALKPTPTPFTAPKNIAESSRKREPKNAESEKQIIKSSNISADAPGEFTTESYKFTVDSIQRHGTTATASVTLESLSNQEIYFTVTTDCYLVDENGNRWTREGYDPARFISAGMSVVPHTKIKSKFSFIALDSAAGLEFTLICTESAPKYGRKIVLRGLLAQ